MRKLSFELFLTAPVLAALAGCNSSAPEPGSPEPATIPVGVKAVHFDELDKAVDDRKGKVVLMDFWATWCGPCVERFPHFVATHKKYRDKGLVTISVSLDPQGKQDKYDEDKVLAFLKNKDATFPNFVLLGYAQDEEKVEKRFGLEGGIPFKALFDKAGKRVWTSEEWAGKKMSVEEQDAQLDKLIESELAK